MTWVDFMLLVAAENCESLSGTTDISKLIQKFSDGDFQML